MTARSFLGSRWRAWARSSRHSWVLDALGFRDTVAPWACLERAEVLVCVPVLGELTWDDVLHPRGGGAGHTESAAQGHTAAADRAATNTRIYLFNPEKSSFGIILHGEPGGAAVRDVEGWVGRGGAEEGAGSGRKASDSSWAKKWSTCLCEVCMGIQPTSISSSGRSQLI